MLERWGPLALWALAIVCIIIGVNLVFGIGWSLIIVGALGLAVALNREIRAALQRQQPPEPTE